MINYNTATLKELFEGLSVSKFELLKRIKDIHINYRKELKEDWVPEEEILINDEKYTTGGDKTYDLSLLKRYYESYSFELLLNDAKDSITIINKLLLEPIIQKSSVGQLRRVAEKKRINTLGQFEDEAIPVTTYKDPSSIYKNSCDLDQFITDLTKITKNLEDFIGKNNPLIKNKSKEIKTEDIKNLTLLENDTLRILKGLEYSCDKAKLLNPESKIVKITFGDINFSFTRKEIVKLEPVFGYLTKNGLNFSVSFDFENEEPAQYLYYNWAKSENEIIFGEIKGESINDIEVKIKGLIKKLEKKKNLRKETKKEQLFWITKNEKGEYLYDGSLVDIKSNKARYIIIFDVVYSLKPEGGDISYKEIINQCKKRGVSTDKKGIQRALTAEGSNASFFRYVKDIVQAPSRGINLFRAKQDGKYLEFNNKK